ncbi:hypothetical protein FSP39_005826 [Pinctada imbricata]|uniref:Transmembrane protein 43 n=1 Tax=Pinctada imbricata TaxID=66713 RepID=A0AA88YAI7_PINIB|nr:hypothetical protein FSP39_005826 [Pinctada imbricata]
MRNSHTRVTYRRNPGFLERVGNSLVGILVGIVLLIGSSALLFWNEGRAVRTAKSLDEGLSLVLPIQSAFSINNENNQKLVHVIGDLQTDKALRDDIYGVSVHAAVLKRKVEMYQWVEHESKREYNEGGQTRTETTYSYDLEWRSELVNSGSFDNTVGHHNPSSYPVDSRTFRLIDQISEFHTLPESALPQPNHGNVRLFNGKYFTGEDPHRPQVGDIRVWYEYSGLSGESMLGKPDKVSIVAKQQGNRLTSYRSSYGNDIEFLYFGELSPEDIFSKEQNKNTFITWGVRFLGWLLMFVGFGCLTSIVTTLVDWLPIVRELVAAGVTIMNLSLSISLSLTVIALGWITYRPLLGLTILAMAATPFIMTKFRSQEPRSSSRYD